MAEIDHSLIDGYEYVPCDQDVNWLSQGLREGHWPEALARRLISRGFLEIAPNDLPAWIFDSLAFKWPVIAAQWRYGNKRFNEVHRYHEDRLEPWEVSPNDPRVVRWECRRCHNVWEEQVARRVTRARKWFQARDLEDKARLAHGTTRKEIQFGLMQCYDHEADWFRDFGCWRCSVERTGSKMENQILETLERAGLDVMARGYTGTVLGNGFAMADAVLPDQSVVIEYDSRRYHVNKEASDIRKSVALLLDGWEVWRLREEGLEAVNLKHQRFHQAVGTNAQLLGVVHELAADIAARPVPSKIDNSLSLGRA